MHRCCQLQFCKRTAATRCMCVLAAENLKGFDKIPGPAGLPGVGSLLSFAAFRPKAHLVWSEWAAKYGPIYKCAATPSPSPVALHACLMWAPTHAAYSGCQLMRPACSCSALLGLTAQVHGAGEDICGGQQSGHAAGRVGVRRVREEPPDRRERALQ